MCGLYNYRICYSNSEAAKTSQKPIFILSTTIKVSSLIFKNLIPPRSEVFFVSGFFSDYFPAYNNQSRCTKNPERVRVFLHRLLDSFHPLDFDLVSLSRPFRFLLDSCISFFKRHHRRSKERKESYVQNLKRRKTKHE